MIPTTTPPGADGKSEELIFKLRLAQNASCSCMTKTNEVAYHAENCLYRVLDEAVVAIAASAPVQPVQGETEYGAIFRAIGDAAKIQGSALAISVKQFKQTLASKGYAIAAPLRASASAPAQGEPNEHLRGSLMAVDAQLVTILNGAEASVYGKLKAARNDLVRIWLPLKQPAAAPLQVSGALILPHEMGYPHSNAVSVAYTNGWNDCRDTARGAIPDDPTNCPAAPVAAPDEQKRLDPVVEANRALLRQRSQFGIKKYGGTLDELRLSRRALMQHALEEALDLANYLQADIQSIDREAAPLSPGQLTGEKK
jgi:hypothetical protein